eukprot:NODE_285_length_10753_cov_0.438615.p5 type:complete len:226 gc:universal NODE_285_length_10753_cov_0.438615:6349-7026(+)
MATTFVGYIKTLEDAMLLINEVEIGNLELIKKRLNAHERQKIKSGSCFVWCTQKSEITRWTDGICWSQSRIHGHFLVYKQVSKKEKIVGGLLKKTISINTLQKNKYHLICYYLKSDVESLKRPIECFNCSNGTNVEKQPNKKIPAESARKQSVINSLCRENGLDNSNLDKNQAKGLLYPIRSSIDIGKWISAYGQCHNAVTDHQIAKLNKHMQLYSNPDPCNKIC